MTTAVIYASKTGNTKKVAEYIARKIGAEAISIKDCNDLSSYDRIIIGTGVYAGKPSKAMRNFIEANKDKLANASLFVTCLYNDDKGAKQLEAIAESFGIADAIFFDHVKKQIGVEGSKLEEYIATL
jgi:menaquinone-dependent protoporphyrinogen oxidase